MAKGAADFIPGLPAGTQTIPPELLPPATEIPIDVEGITATNLAEALAELLDAISA